MSQIEELQRRINAALDRIGQGLDNRGGGADAEELAAAQQALEDEKLANAQLEERVKTLRARIDEIEDELAAAGERSAAALAEIDGKLQALQAANEQLRENNRALRAANAEGVGEPQLINTGLQAEIDGLRAARAADRAAIDAVVIELNAAIDGAAEQTAEGA